MENEISTPAVIGEYHNYFHMVSGKFNYTRRRFVPRWFVNLFMHEEFVPDIPFCEFITADHGFTGSYLDPNFAAKTKVIDTVEGVS